MLIAFFVIPGIVFPFCLLCTLPLWAIECHEGQGCSFYEWFKYLMSNMLGLATPLTDYSPESGHVVAEMVDLLISTWSLSIAGCAIGVVSTLSFTGIITGGLDRKLQQMYLKATERRIRNLASDKSGLSMEEFRLEIERRDLAITPERAADLFREADADGSGVIEQAEVEKLLASLESTVLSQTALCDIHKTNAATIAELRAMALSNQEAVAELSQALATQAQLLQALTNRLEGAGVLSK